MIKGYNNGGGGGKKERGRRRGCDVIKLKPILIYKNNKWFKT